MLRATVRFLALSTTLVATLAFAQERGFSVDRYEGSTPGSWLFLLERPWYSSTRFFAAGVTVDYAHDPLQPRVLTGRGPLTPIVSNALVGHVELAGSLFDRLLLSASLPVTLLETGTPELVSQAGPLPGLGVGDPRVGVMVRLFGQAERDAFSLHLGAAAWIPIGAQGNRLGDSGVRLLPRAVLAGAGGALRWTVELGFLARPYASIGPPALGLIAAPEARAGLALGVSLLHDSLYLGAETQFAMQVVGDAAFTPSGMSLEALGGIHYLIADTLLLGVAGGSGFFGAAGTPDARAVVRLSFAPRRSDDGPEIELTEVRVTRDDADLDGVPDVLDRCPFEPETKNGVRDEDGCPEFQLEQGAPLARILAPRANPPTTRITTRPTGADGATDAGSGSSTRTSLPAATDTRGATLTSGASATDAGSASSTRSATDAGAATVASSANTSDAGSATSTRPSLPTATDAGSATSTLATVVGVDLPVSFDAADSDDDGVADAVDRCPITPEDLDGFEDEDGCPEPDNDSDGIADADDRCPFEAETINALTDEDGCPDVAPDADQDGVADGVDRCPFEPEDLQGFRDEDGCPEFTSPVQFAVAKFLAAPARVTSPTATEPLPVGDADQDGVDDAADRCPVTPEDRDGFEDEDGCPEADNDGDGVSDGKDQCPEVAETINGFKDADGCADENPDSDADGVDYEADRCPLEPGAAPDGCPHLPRPALALPGFALPLAAADAPPTDVPSTADFDRDGVPDAVDSCPMGAEDRDGYEDEDGCAEPDNDSDGIADGKDKCPFEAETINGKKDDDGCPDPGPGLVHVRAGAVVIDDVVRFKTASATLEKTAPPLLKQVASTLRAAASLSIEIQGHTDDTGNAATNIRLSQRRAETIVAFLVKAGVAKNRLVAKGFGPTRPRATNKTAEGREQNRRVEFLIIGEAK